MKSYFNTLSFKSTKFNERHFEIRSSIRKTMAQSELKLLWYKNIVNILSISSKIMRNNASKTANRYTWWNSGLPTKRLRSKRRGCACIFHVVYISKFACSCLIIVALYIHRHKTVRICSQKFWSTIRNIKFLIVLMTCIPILSLSLRLM